MLFQITKQMYIALNIQYYTAEFPPQLADDFSLSISPAFSVFVIFQPAEVFEFEGNVYSHHLSPIARKHSLIAGVLQAKGFDIGVRERTS